MLHAEMRSSFGSSELNKSHLSLFAQRAFICCCSLVGGVKLDDDLNLIIKRYIKGKSSAYPVSDPPDHYQCHVTSGFSINVEEEENFYFPKDMFWYKSTQFLTLTLLI